MKKEQIIARVQFKKNGYVAYKVLSSNSVDTYTTTIVNGKATGCTCKATKRCYHMVQLKQIEAERTAQQREAYCQTFAIYA